MGNDYFAYKLDLHGKMDIASISKYKCNSLEKFFIRNDEYIADYPEAKYKETTGFLAYFLTKQAFNRDVVLCNFGVKDTRFVKTAKIHGIVFEDSYFS